MVLLKAYAGIIMVNLSIFEDHPKYKFIHGEIYPFAMLIRLLLDAIFCNKSHQFNRGVRFISRLA